MRGVFLAFILLFTLANSDQQDESQTTNSAIQALVDKEEHELALDAARQAAEKGEAVGHDWLGYFYEFGRGVDANTTLAAKHYRIAAAQGENHARWRLGVLIDQGKAEGSLEEAVEFFRLAAQEDFTDAMVSLAVMHATGRGTPVDYEASFRYYTQAAQAGDSHGVQGVGVLFALGQGTSRDLEEAAAWFLVSTALGNEVGEANFTRVTNGMSDEQLTAIVTRAEEIADGLGVEVNLEFYPDAPPVQES